MKQLIKDALEKNRDQIFSVGDQLFQLPELGFQEVETEKVICEYLDGMGICYQKHVSMHGVIATMGEGNNYHIGIVADMDALLTSMEGVLVPFHSCGHSIQVAVLLNVITALKECDILSKLDGKVSFIFAPAEEFIDLESREQLKEEGKIRFFSGKQNMIYEGVFDSLDVVLSCHVMGPDEKCPNAKFDVNSTLAGFLHKKAVFRGQAAHAGVIPYLGRSALHAANLSLTAVLMLKDTFMPEANAKVYPILKEGGSTANIICDYAVIETYVRANSETSLQVISKQLDNAFIHCAKAVETTCEITNQNGYLPLIQDKELNQVVHLNMLGICKEEEIIHDVVSGASGDLGDLSFLMPTIQFGFSGIKGFVHSNQFQIEDKIHVYEDTAYVIAGTIIDLLSDKKLQVVKTNYDERKHYYLNNWLDVSETL